MTAHQFLRVAALQDPGLLGRRPRSVEAAAQDRSFGAKGELVVEGLVFVSQVQSMAEFGLEADSQDTLSVLPQADHPWQARSAGMYQEAVPLVSEGACWAPQLAARAAQAGWV